MLDDAERITLSSLTMLAVSALRDVENRGTEAIDAADALPGPWPNDSGCVTTIDEHDPATVAWDLCDSENQPLDQESTFAVAFEMGFRLCLSVVRDPFGDVASIVRNAREQTAMFAADLGRDSEMRS